MENDRKNINIQIGKRLREARTNMNIDKSEFARVLDVTEEHYRKLEAGATGLSADKILILYHTYGIDPTYEADDYLEKIFPFFGIRFIAITDGYDSSCPNLTEDGLIVPLKNLINDIYAKDLSRKVSSAFLMKQKQGKFIGMSAPYGYMKSPADHNKLIVDEDVKEIVWNIFHWRADGESLTSIARRLNDCDIPCPIKYKYLKGWVKSERSKSGLWTVSTLARVLENPVYIGDMEQGIARTALYKGMKTTRMPVEERIYVKNTHEPIVEREIFEKINEQREQFRKKFHSNYGKHDSISKEPNLLKGVLVCADCGKNMSLWRDRSGVKLNPPRVYYKYICQTYQTLKEKGCTRKRLNKKNVEMAVEEAVRLHIKLFLDARKALEQLNRTEQARQINAGYQREILESCKRKSKAENRAASLYNDYADGILSESDYLYAKEKYLTEAKACEQRINELQELQRRYEKGCKENSKLETIVEKYKNFDNLTEEIIQSFISKVLVYSDERLEICFRFKDELDELIQVIEEGRDMQGESTVTDGGKYIIALYIRLSQEDRDVSLRADKAESNSITNQRALLWDFIRSHEEFADCTVVEKCDDGYSGVHFDSRPQFTELIELAKAGKINCIIVKDFSRFGRNYVELGDYLEQYFPFLGVRFISVNDNYDSKDYEGTTGGLDVAFKNMIYDFYSREVSKKQRIAWRRMAEKGEYNAHCAMYGYKKADDNVHQLVIHEETGKIVKEIFELVASGVSPLKVAKMLNERDVPAPSEFQNMQGYQKEWSRYSAKCYWTDDRIRSMIKDERYTGTMISLKTTSFTVRGKRVKTPPSEWVRVEDTHEPIVSYELFVKANTMFRQMKFRLSGKSGKNIYHCGYCGRKMQKDKKFLRCHQRYVVKECKCRSAVISFEEADQTVLAALKQQIQLFIKAAELSKEAKKKVTPYSERAEITTLIKSIATLKKTWMPLYEQYTDGKLSREDFLMEKKKYDEETARLEQRLQELQSRQEIQQENHQQIEKNISQLKCYADQMELTEEIKEKLIDKVKVYSDNRIEICWKFDSGFLDTETMHKCG